MKKKYAFHPGDYAIGETEKFYSDMAAKGWELEKRGGMLSKFKRTEPKRIRYRIELIPRSFLERDGEHVPDEEQLAVFEDCGWTYVTGANSVHVFSASQGTNAPEFYLNPEQQAPIVKKIRNFNIFYFFLYFFIFFTRPIIALFFGDSLSKIFADYCYTIICSSTFELFSMIFMAILVVSFFAHYLVLIIKLHSLQGKLKNGIPIDHSPAKKSFHFPFALLAIISAVFYLIFFILSEFYPIKTHIISNAFENPSISLSDTGIDTSKDAGYFGHNIYIEYSKAALSEYWYCEEIVNGSGDNDIKMIQEIYQLKLNFLSERFVNSLMHEHFYDVHAEDFIEIEFSELDNVWQCEEYIIAVNDDLVYLIRYRNDFDDDITPILQAIAENDYEGMK